MLSMKSVTYMVSVIVLGLCLSPRHDLARAAEQIKFAMTAEHWTTTGEVEFVQRDGYDALQLNPGNSAAHKMTGQAVLNDFTFRNGTIEYDVEPLGSMGAGIGFRRRDKDTYEDFYLRPRANCSEAADCTQYAPQTHGVLLWDLFPQYQAPAPLREGEWNHIKLVISGQRMNVFINGGKSPTLKIGRLEGDAQEGGLLLQGPGLFANLSVIPDAVEGLPAEPEKDATAEDHHFVRNWQLAPYSALPADKEPSATDLPAPSAAWLPLAAERSGLVNISRQYGLPLTRPDRAVAWLRTTIISDKIQSKKVNFGWSREVWVFVNGSLVYADKNLYQPPTARKTPDGRCSLENGSFQLPLKAGANEVSVAVANNFYGWGLILRLDDVDGVQFMQP
jgi:hypothetical protein